MEGKFVKSNGVELGICVFLFVRELRILEVLEICRLSANFHFIFPPNLISCVIRGNCWAFNGLPVPWGN